MHTPTATGDVLALLRTALTGTADRPLVLLGNFEVEEHWARGEPGLPGIVMPGSRVVVNRMDECALLLAGPDDHVVLKAAPDEEYLRYLGDLGLALPRVLTVGNQQPQRTVSEDAVTDAPLVAALGRLAAAGAHLWPHGVSVVEERLAELSGLPLAAPTAAVCKQVNSKIYSRLLADELELPQPEGMVCRDIDELDRAVHRAGGWLDAGRPIVLKDAYGVSGRGIMVVRDTRRLAQLRTLIARRAQRGGGRVGVIVEEWLPKRHDLNYQMTVDRAGAVHFDVVKEAITSDGVHQGHRMPAPLTPRQHRQVQTAAETIGRRLAADGYFGVVGVDALTTTDDRLYPIIEINARNNMSTYQERLRRTWFGPETVALARQYPLRLIRPLPFGELRALLDGVLADRPGRPGLVINNFATVNAAAAVGAEGASFGGRLYGVVAADSDRHVAAIDREVTDRLRDCAATVEQP
ncbi:ATP-grasp domain-containing protein [Micromonospora sp. KC723]|uniref:preATP grasp domain-containing protein n=1 Tax=Micromonospora sp. KC723 TaxID=2530381 RepID=UPI001042D74A|nr:ATP-grasp domain-containing protein [Micromonospora sp. KC723]TDB74913.1 ATP-grasp domain-containing protein [Micromonospora sp. KC723]